MLNPFIVLISHGCDKTLSFLLEHYQPEELLDAVMFIDCQRNCVFNHIVLAEDEDSQIRILDLLYEHFCKELHWLVGSARGIQRLVLFMCLSTANEIVCSITSF